MSHYEDWVDSLIQTHKQRLDTLKTCKYAGIDSKSEYRKLPVFQETYQSNNSVSISKDLEDYKALKQRRIEKIYEDTLKENAELKLSIKDKDNTISELRSNNNFFERDNKTNSIVFLEREKDLIETIKLLDIDNKRLEEKIKELKIELSKKSKDLDMALNLNREFKFSNSPNFKTFSSNDDDLQLLSAKYDKIIETFINFFNIIDKG
jgi:hypothetical protein